MSITFLSPMTYTYINLPTKWGYTKFDSSTQPSGDILIVYTWLKYSNYYISLPMHSGGTNYIRWPKKDSLKDYDRQRHIMGLYMAFSSSDIHEIYNKDQRSKQDHDSHQQLSYTIYDLLHKHLSATSSPTTCICPSSFPNIR